ncbi:AAA family ATPase [Pseudomonas sp. 2,4-D]|uniref:AAA family ATPase n=1 Tax=Pseudomonas sp. 2,4-D TaxID=3058433 RepID=UPI002621D005|nr:AAA family ATPase [Pseudomonas sp. 2,4-D]MDN4514674.1 AAA family ATPase [Pseudomonas sp. 2,4-D]
MYLKRVQIDDGFLEGLDVQLSEGLNTIIGARGTGKTSLLELIRFCLGTSGFSSGHHKKSFEHALSVIGDGKITVSLEDNGKEILVSRGAADASPYATAPFVPPIILSQTEVETVGLLAQGRLELIDSFITNLSDFDAYDGYITAEIQNVSSEVDALIKERADTLDSLLELQAINTELNNISEREKQIASFSATAAEKQAQINLQANTLSTLSIQDAYIERFNDRINEALANISKGINMIASAEKWIGDDSTDPLVGIRKALSEQAHQLYTGHVSIQNLIPPMNVIRAGLQSRRASIEEANRVLRKEFESMVEGAGAISREASRLRERKATLENLAMFAADQEVRIANLVAMRNDYLNKMEHSRQSKYLWRKQICDSINQALGPKIKVKVDQSGQIDAYTSLLSEILRGSGLKYNEIARAISSLVSPRELSELVQSSNFDQLSNITGITKDRATKLLNHLRDVGMGELLTCPIEDVITFQLLDGSSYKDLSQLSTGQRCTVVLPIVLEHTSRVIIVDQPEDHIDNAFIAETLIKSIRRRSDNSQIIFTTHNANIPVLGYADRVIQMESDGRRGYVQLEKTLNHHDSIEAISNVMEGGKAAFDYRAKFYAGSKE